VVEGSGEWKSPAGVGIAGLVAGLITQIIDNTVSDVDIVDRVTGGVRDAVVASCVDGLWRSHGRKTNGSKGSDDFADLLFLSPGFSFLCSATAFVLWRFSSVRGLWRDQGHSRPRENVILENSAPHRSV
jgi:hypothetical protein